MTVLCYSTFRVFGPLDGGRRKNQLFCELLDVPDEEGCSQGTAQGVAAKSWDPAVWESAVNQDTDFLMFLF